MIPTAKSTKVQVLAMGRRACAACAAVVTSLRLCAWRVDAAVTRIASHEVREAHPNQCVHADASQNVERLCGLLQEGFAQRLGLRVLYFLRSLPEPVRADRAAQYPHHSEPEVATQAPVRPDETVIRPLHRMDGYTAALSTSA